MTKYTLLVAGCLLGAVTTGYAQTTGLHVGVKAGLNEAVLDGTINKGAEFRTAGHLGVVLRWRPTKSIAVQPELVFSQQGSANRIPLRDATIENKTRLTYLNVPLLLKVYLGNRVNLQVGPQFGMLLGARLKGQTGYINRGGDITFIESDVDQKGNYRKGDIGLCGGLGIDLDNGLLFAARFNYGLTNIDKVGAELREQLELGGLHNRVIEASVGYLFGKK